MGMTAAAATVLLDPAQMAQADRHAMAGGQPGTVLMARAGDAVARAIQSRWAPRTTWVLCGPGNNGGDGFVVASRLHAAGWPVRVALLGDPSDLRGDAAWHAERWQGGLVAPEDVVLHPDDLIVDALFGAGLQRPLTGWAARWAAHSAERGVPVCAVDLPSGIDGRSGAVLGAAFQATLTVTFVRKKPGHLLRPGHDFVGELVVDDIGVSDADVAASAARTWENHPALWCDAYPWPAGGSHKYTRGEAVVAGSATMPGAARLAAHAAARAGAGLVSLAAPPAAWPLYAAAPAACLLRPVDTLAHWQACCAQPTVRAVLLGPGMPADEDTAARADAALACRQRDGAPMPVVLDAGALTALAQRGPAPMMPHGRVVLTPHQGEFDRLFPAQDDSAQDKLARTRLAAAACGAVVVCKGADTVIAAPDGRALINTHASPALATGGTGDVLAGVITGLLAQGMPPFEAAAMAVWMHGDAAQRLGTGLIADDLPGALPAVWRGLSSLEYAG